MDTRAPINAHGYCGRTKGSQAVFCSIGVVLREYSKYSGRPGHARPIDIRFGPMYNYVVLRATTAGRLRGRSLSMPLQQSVSLSHALFAVKSAGRDPQGFAFALPVNLKTKLT